MATDPMRPQHPWDWPCGPDGSYCELMPERCGTMFMACPIHAAAAHAGPFMVRAEETFRERVLKSLDELYDAMIDRDEEYRCGVMGAIDTIRDLPTGQIDDARRMAKQERDDD